MLSRGLPTPASVSPPRTGHEEINKDVTWEMQILQCAISSLQREKQLKLIAIKSHEQLQLFWLTEGLLYNLSSLIKKIPPWLGLLSVYPETDVSFPLVSFYQSWCLVYLEEFTAKVDTLPWTCSTTGQPMLSLCSEAGHVGVLHISPVCM